MKKTFLILAGTIVTTACCTNKPLENPIKGEVFDATMNNISIITAQNDTLNFSTIALGDAGRKIGVFLGDTISVAYTPFEGEQARPNYFNATEMTLIYRKPCLLLTGEWIEPNPINSAENQGFIFNIDGTASSIGMATLECSKWVLGNKTLTLTMTSKGVKNPSTTEVTYTVKTLNDQSLVLCEGERVIFNLTHPAH